MSAQPDVLPLVSVIVPVRDPDGGLFKLLDCLKAQTLEAERFEVIVIDDGSKVGIPDVLQQAYPQVCFMKQQPNGAYWARNTGVHASRGRILAFTDADCLPEPDWLAEGLAAMGDEERLVAGRVDVLVDDPASVVQRYDARFNLKQAFYVREIGFGVTANLFVPRAVYDRVGGFATQLYSGGDQRFCQDVAEHGIGIHYAENAAIRHPARRRRRELVGKTVRVAKGRAYAFPKAGYYFPRILQRLPTAYQDVSFSKEPFGFRWRFYLLHYYLETVRILTYIKIRLFADCRLAG